MLVVTAIFAEAVVLSLARDCTTAFLFLRENGGGNKEE
jgi:hypothetical protein